MSRAPVLPKLPPRYTPVVFAFFMSGIVAFMMSLALTALNTGLDSGLALRVIRAYAAAWPVGFFSVLIARPLVLRLVALTVKQAR